MCGIAGIVSRGSLTGQHHAEMNHLLTAMVHRGPDGSRAEAVSPSVLLGSNRLRITDALNPEADMPMRSSSGRYDIVYNGEIYNHRALRHQLPNYNFRTASDTETILAAFETWGKNCLDKFEGMFAFAVYDQQEKETFLAVDPSGQKFLYYLQDREAALFASEIEPLIIDPHRRKSWDHDAISEYISQRMILGPDTHIKEIKKLEAGNCATIGADGIVKTRRYYTVPLGDQERDNVAEISSEIKTAFLQGCDDTFHLEVPYGYLLSGGIDSSAVVQFAKNKGFDLNTYSIGFNYFEGDNFNIPSTFNEFDYSRFMAAHAGSRHHEIEMRPEEYVALIDRWIAMCGEPLDSSEAPMLIRLFDQAAKDKLKVVFCGSGPDEAFDGYGLGKSLTDVTANALTGAYYDRFNWTFAVDLEQLMPGRKTRDKVIAKMNKLLEPYRDQTADPLQLAQLLNLQGRCVAYEYRQMDVISMRHSIETRSPLADTRMTKAAFDFNPALKQHNGEDKWIYKQAFRGFLPNKIVDREKVGFPTPIELWFTQSYQERVRTIFEPNSAMFSLGIMDERYARETWNTGLPEYRCIDYRLYLLNRLIERQRPFIS